MIANQAVEQTSPDMWWAYSETQGWVVLDKSFVENCSAINPAAYIFTRYRDGEDFEQGDNPWDYKEAARYIASLTPGEAFQKAGELRSFQEEYMNEMEAAA